MRADKDMNSLPEGTDDMVPASFFLPESREGFYVSDMMKRYWAAQLKVLHEIRKICARHDIPWYADYGSLIGAVRHGGYIPWDDDFDICMMRHDLRRFIKAAEKELPEGYVILDLEHEPEYTMYLTRIVNARAINYSEEHLNRFYGCPYTVGVDIFPLDGLYDDEEREESRRRQAFDAMLASRLAAEGKADTPECREKLAKLEQTRHIRFKQGRGLVRQLLLLTDKLFSECDSETASHVAVMPFWAEYHDHRFDKEWFRHVVMMSFEYTTLPVSTHYDLYLRTVYGDYMRIVKSGGMHDYPVYRDQEEIFRESTGRYPWRYTFDPADSGQMAERQPTRAGKQEQMTQLLTQASAQIEALQAAGQEEAAGQLAEGCKKLADSLEELLAHQKEIVFLAVKADWWNTMEGAWKAACADDSVKVTVIAVPYIETDPDGNNPHPVDESTLFPEYVPLTKASEYDFGARHPDVIVMQHPYDGFCNAVSVPDFFFASRLRLLTDCLVYIPCHELYTPDEADGKARAALQVLAEQPASIFADRIVLPTEGLRDLFIESLIRIAGENIRSGWEEKVVCPRDMALFLQTIA